MMPWMNQLQVLFIDSVLLLLARNYGFLECLEWGAGGSTVHFPHILNSTGVNYKWTSLEYDRKWFDRVRAETNGNCKVELAYFDIKSGNPLSSTVRMDEYVEYPRTTLKRQFDFILIDGRKRRRCLLEARSLVKDTGMVILHDANRAHYRCAFSHYDEWKEPLQDLWVGLGSKQVLTRICDPSERDPAIAFACFLLRKKALRIGELYYWLKLNFPDLCCA